ncbi:hypothetical protein Tco_1403070 [Tanacetum coccineum]
MNDPNITMEEFIRLEEENARKRGKVFNWETAKYGKIWYDEDNHDLRSVEDEFLAIAFNDGVSSKTLSCEPTVSSFNDEIDFRVSFDDSDDEYYTVIFDKNSFSYKIISTNDLKTDSKNDNEKVNLPSLPSPEPAISCFDDLDFFKDFESEFLAISEYDEEEQNVLYFNDLFPFNIIHPDDLKPKKDNDDKEIDIIQSSKGNEITHRISYARDFLGTTPSYTAIRDPILRLCHRLISYSVAGRSQAPEKVTVTDLFYLRRIDVSSVNVPYLLARYLRFFAVERESGAHISGGQFVARLTEHFGLLTSDAAAGAHGAAEDTPIDDEGGQAVSTPMQAP